MKTTYKYLVIAVAMLTAASCKKDFLETKPANGVTTQQIFQDIPSTKQALAGIYNEMFATNLGVPTGTNRADDFGQKAFDLQSDLMANDMVMHSLGYNWFTTDYNYSEWTRVTAYRQCDNAWYYYYDIIKQVNVILGVIDAIPNATQAEIESIKGQCLGFRAYAYFYLINYFQQSYKGHENSPGVPIYTEVTTTGKARGKVSDVYAQIIADLTAAEGLLASKPRESKVNIDISVIEGFRARVALLMEDWATAATYANRAKTGYPLMSSSEYVAQDAFSNINNPEWMWGSYIPEALSTVYNSFFSHMDVFSQGYAYFGGQKKITKALYDQIPSGDARKDVFTAPGTGVDPNVDYNQVKHKIPNPGNWAGDYLYMRASEMYLIEAEALARSGNDAGARGVLETMVKARYPAYSAASLSGQALIDEILLQRRIELWGEGFSLMDIKRLGQGLNRPTGPGNHGSPNLNPGILTTGPNDPRWLMHIPQRELDNNENMTPADQNP